MNFLECNTLFGSVVLERSCVLLCNEILPYFRTRGYKTLFMLNSVEHEILKAHKYINIKKFGIFKAQISLKVIFSAHKC